ncbi:ATP synthase subunit I [Fimbriiglobus ruber]|uniref:Sodium-transporting ATPase subunit R n=1 Tax=Fimbriiglobus ruber TaxID=1908690 RepID=A0A225DME1_9BACT|nr:ATP synthase subunit I [Fimbriiglobus ruber]OWK37357.1 Sodium-transporting ATPase subunit R [Fimbriiglobus ruber]
MSELITLVPAALAGGVLGAGFFGGLWWTVTRAVSSPAPAVWFLVSMLLRTGVALAGFYFVAQGDWTRLLACLAGFLAARAAVTRLTRPAEEKPHRLAEEVGREP